MNNSYFYSQFRLLDNEYLLNDMISIQSYVYMYT